MTVKIISYSQPSEELADQDIKDVQDLVSYCARVSNPSNQYNTGTASRLINYLLRHKHFSPFEMVNVCLEIDTPRDIGRQMIRHRSFAFQEYCLCGTSVIDLLVDGFEPTHMTLFDLYTEYKRNHFMVMCYDEIAQKMSAAPIKEVFYTGKKEIYQVTLTNGNNIKCTKDHKFLTDYGFESLESIMGLNMENVRTLTTLLKEGVYTLENGSPKLTEIASVTYAGFEDTYDIEVDHVSHNYVANGFIVHNSQRYADPTKDLSFVIREARLQDHKNRQNSIPITDMSDPSLIAIAKMWEVKQNEVLQKAKEVYTWAINNGIAKECARVVLPEGMTMSRMQMNGSIRSWIHYIEARMHEGTGTQKEHREIAFECAKVIAKVFPFIEESY